MFWSQQENEEQKLPKNSDMGDYGKQKIIYVDRTSGNS